MKNQGFSTVVAAVAIQLTLGVIYIWSVFQDGIKDTIFGGDNAAAALTFSLVVALMCVGSIVGGKLVERFSTRPIIFVGGLIMSLGIFSAAFVTAENAWLLWATYGVMGGFGMGFAYSTTIACAQKWYPHKKGLVSGFIVFGLGIGGVVFTPIAEWAIGQFGGQGVGEQPTFILLAAIILVVCSVGSFFIKDAPDGYMTSAVASSATTQKTIKNLTTTEMFKTPQFYLLTVSFVLACLAGFMTSGFARPIAFAHGLANPAIAVLAFTLFNSAGRLFWGMVSDKLGRINTLVLLLSLTAILVILLAYSAGVWVFVLIAVIGLVYGGFLSNFPSLTADLFGSKYMAGNYGFVLLGFGSSALIATQIAGYYKDIADNYGDIGRMTPAFYIASACAVAGIVLMLVLKKISKQK